MADSDSSSTSHSDASDSEPDLMITSRAKRATAGNRYSQVVAQEQQEEADEEDDVALLFAEDEEEDEEYNSDEADDEADMSESDDDNDQGPNAAPDDMDGEKEIQNQAKAERQKKRKADLALTTGQGIRKKARIDPTALHRAPDRLKPSKRKERVSWLPDQDGTPAARASSRQQTVAHREVLLERLKENEEQRLKFKAIREQKEKQKQAEAPKELTQADRLAEAERIERRNAKSLNRWEAMEKRRAEEQAARLAALKDRKLDGAVIAFHSARHVFKGFKSDMGTPGPSEDGQPKKRGRKPKAPLEPASSPATGEVVQLPFTNTILASTKPVFANSPLSQSVLPTPIFAAQQLPLQSQHHPSVSTSQPGTDLPTMIPPQAPQPIVVPISATSTSQLPLPTDEITIEPVNDDSKNQSTNIMPSVERVDDRQPLQVQIPQADLPLSSSVQLSSMSEQTSTPLRQSPVIEVVSTQNLIGLDKMDQLETEARQAHSVFFNTKKTAKPTKHATEICAMTGLSARYRDPVTKVPYVDVAAYKKLKEVISHQYQWSSMLGCYVGRAGVAARGVPEGFLS